jgi:uncharacterized OsmC-like protein
MGVFISEMLGLAIGDTPRPFARLSPGRAECILPYGTHMELTVNYLDGVKFEASARGHRVISDQPVENSGTDAGMSPPELMLASLGTCAMYYAAEYLRARSLSAGGLTVKVTAEKALKPARLASFRIHVQVPQLQPQHAAGLDRAVKHCLIHNTLLQPPSIETVIETAAAVTA